MEVKKMIANIQKSKYVYVPNKNRRNGQDNSSNSQNNEWTDRAGITLLTEIKPLDLTDKIIPISKIAKNITPTHKLISIKKEIKNLDFPEVNFQEDTSKNAKQIEIFNLNAYLTLAETAFYLNRMRLHTTKSEISEFKSIQKTSHIQMNFDGKTCTRPKYSLSVSIDGIPQIIIDISPDRTAIYHKNAIKTNQESQFNYKQTPLAALLDVFIDFANKMNTTIKFDVDVSKYNAVKQ